MKTRKTFFNPQNIFFCCRKQRMFLSLLFYSPKRRSSLCSSLQPGLAWFLVGGDGCPFFSFKISTSQSTKFIIFINFAPGISLRKGEQEKSAFKFEHGVGVLKKLPKSSKCIPPPPEWTDFGNSRHRKAAIKFATLLFFLGLLKKEKLEFFWEIEKIEVAKMGFIGEIKVKWRRDLIKI